MPTKETLVMSTNLLKVVFFFEDRTHLIAREEVLTEGKVPSLLFSKDYGGTRFKPNKHMKVG